MSRFRLWLRVALIALMAAGVIGWAFSDLILYEATPKSGELRSSLGKWIAFTPQGGRSWKGVLQRADYRWKGCIGLVGLELCIRGGTREESFRICPWDLWRARVLPPEEIVNIGQVTLPAKRVVYVLYLPAGNSGAIWHDLTMVIMDSVGSLRSQQSFDVIWPGLAGKPKVLFGKMVPAEQAAAALATSKLTVAEHVNAEDVWPCIEEAFARKPDAVVLVGCGSTIDNTAQRPMMHGDSGGTPVYAFSITDDGGWMAQLGWATGGFYRKLETCCSGVTTTE